MKLRKVANWVLAITFIVFLIDWGVVGIKLLDNNYNITVEAYIGLVCFIIIFVSIIIRTFTDRCPHCGKIRATKGAYCSYCGKEIKTDATGKSIAD